MRSYREYGRAPFAVAVIHGGPGAPGYMAPVARELSLERGVLEPLQSAASVEGQIEELRAALENRGEPPVVLIGSSWGAMLGYLLAARYPNLVKKLIMVGSAVYEDRYATAITETRLGRLDSDERREARTIMESLEASNTADGAVLLARLDAMFTRADCYDPLSLDTGVLEYQQELNRKVWMEAEELRRSGELLRLGSEIRSPVVAIHGDYDPHPADGVREPLSRVLRDFRFILLESCGHYPWLERAARDSFYGILERSAPAGVELRASYVIPSAETRSDRGHPA